MAPWIYSAISFAKESLAFGTTTYTQPLLKHLPHFIAIIVVVAGRAYPSVVVYDKWTIDMASTIFLMLFLALSMGYGYARFYRARIIASDTLEVAEPDASIRIPVHVKGYGKPLVTAYVEDVRNGKGEMICRDAKGLKLEWTFHENVESLELHEESPYSSVSLYSVHPAPNVKDTRMLLLHGVKVEKHVMTGKRFHPVDDEIWTKVKLHAEGSESVSKWYGVKYDPSTHLCFAILKSEDKKFAE